jgi:hypothetical protein
MLPGRIACLSVASAVIGILASACSSGSAASSKGSCLEQTAPSAACFQCGQSNCASQISAVESACAAYIGCICPGGTYDATAGASAACKSDLGGDCQTADATFTQCIQQSCAGVCPGKDGG